MAKKTVLAKFIRDGNHTLEEWYGFMPKVRGLRVKDIHSSGDVLISIDDTGWWYPENWLLNYQAAIRERLYMELRAAGDVLPQEEFKRVVYQCVNEIEASQEKSLQDLLHLR